MQSPLKHFNLLLLYILMVVHLFSCGQKKADQYTAEVKEWQNGWNIMFSDTSRSPLPDSLVPDFEGLHFFPLDESFRVEADFTLTPDSEPFQMPTTTSRLVWYKKFGEARFTFGGAEHTLAIFQNQEILDIEEYKDHLFLPYKDLTNGEETYGGGRYIDLKIPGGDKIVIDFNKSYNPYCAYNSRYSCPIPPDENHLDIEIRAGVLGYDH